MTEGYITVREIVKLAKAYIDINSKAGFTKSITETATEDATLEDGRYVISIKKIADIKIDNGKNTILWHQPDNAELYNIYVGGWFNAKRDIYEVEQVLILNNIDNAIKYAFRYKQDYIYDLQGKRLINANQYRKLKKLETSLNETDTILDKLRHEWLWTKDKVEYIFLWSAYNDVMKVRKSLAKRVVLLKNQGVL